MSLEDLRKKINAIDDHILRLLEDRADVAREVADVKIAAGRTVFHDPEREEQVIARLQAASDGRFPPEGVRAVYREIMSSCLALEQPMRIAFLGPAGAFAYLAAKQMFGLGARYRELPSVRAVFESIAFGDSAYGVVPMESSTEGVVTPTIDALMAGDLLIRREAILESRLSLLGRESLSGVARVVGTPQMLDQCRVWLAKNLPNAPLVSASSPSFAAKEASDDESVGAVGSPLSAGYYGLHVLCDNILDRPEESTRFIVVAKEDGPRTGDDKTAIAFGMKDGRGVLRRALGHFDDAGVNLTRIESRPNPEIPWSVHFYVDIDGHREDANVATAINNLRSQCDMLKVLGSYPRFVPQNS